MSLLSNLIGEEIDIADGTFFSPDNGAGHEVVPRSRPCGKEGAGCKRVVMKSSLYANGCWVE